MTDVDQQALLISSAPTLRPAMTMPWSTESAARPFPLNEPSLRYYYLARNAIYALIKLWKLSGEEILFPSYFHGVEFETLTACGVKLRYYEVHSRMRIDVDEVVSRITPATRAVYLIHYLGFPGPAAELARVCKDRGLKLIEDCALALLSKDGNRPLGSFGDAAVFCLYKTLPVPNGGALLVKDPGQGEWPPTQSPTFASTMAYTASAIWRHLRFNGGGPLHRMLQAARNSARAMSDSLGVVPVGDNHFNPATVELEMSRVCHWILGHQDYEGVVERRRRNYLHLMERIRDFAPPYFDGLPAGVCPLFYPVYTKDKMKLFERLMARGVEAVNFWSQTPASIAPGTFPEADDIRASILELPCHQDLTVEQIDALAAEFRSLWGRL